MTLRTGFEPVRVEPNGFQVHLLNHSDTAAYTKLGEIVNYIEYLKFRKSSKIRLSI